MMVPLLEMIRLEKFTVYLNKDQWETIPLLLHMDILLR